jgi:hypothetical protein
LIAFLLQSLAIELAEASGYKGAHTVAQNNQGQLLLFGDMVDKLPLIIDYLIPTIMVGKMIETVSTASGHSVAAMVSSGDHNSMLVKECRQTSISGAMLGHTVHNMQPRYRLLWHPLVVVHGSGIATAKVYTFILHKNLSPRTDLSWHYWP